MPPRKKKIVILGDNSTQPPEPPPPPPPPPPNEPPVIGVLSLGTREVNAITLNWTAATAAPETPVTSYTIYVRQGTTVVNTLTGIAATARNRRIANLTANTQYSFRISATNSVGESAQSNSIVGTTLQQTTSMRRLLGVYSGGPGTDARINRDFGMYPEVSSTYVQTAGQNYNHTGEAGRLSRGTATNITITSKGTEAQRAAGGTGYIADLGPPPGTARGTTAVNWINAHIDRLKVLSDTSDTPVFATFEHEFDVKSVQGELGTGNSADPIYYARALSFFIAQCRTRAPKVKPVYWYGGFQQGIIDTVMSNLTEPPDAILFDNYTNQDPASKLATNTTPAETLRQCLQVDVDRHRISGRIYHSDWVRLGQPRLGCGEIGISKWRPARDELVHNDAQMETYCTDIRNVLRDLDLWFAILFNRDSGPNGHQRISPYDPDEIPSPGGERPRALARYGRSMAAAPPPEDTGGGTDPTPNPTPVTGVDSVIDVSVTTTVVGDPDTSNTYIRENSGLALSRRNGSSSNRIFYGHNDQDTTARIFAFGGQAANTEPLAVITLSGAGTSDQFEDIAVGPGPDATKSYIYVGRIGAGAATPTIYRFEEPAITPGQARTSITVTPTVFTFTRPTGVNDAEAFFVDHLTGNLFWFQKKTVSAGTARPISSKVYRINNIAGKTTGGNVDTDMTDLGELTCNVQSVNNGGFTAASITPNGRYIALCNYQEIFVWYRDPATTSMATLFTNTPTAQFRKWMTTDNGATTTWGGEALEWDFGEKPGRLYGLPEGASGGSRLEYTTVEYSA